MRLIKFFTKNERNGCIMIYRSISRNDNGYAQHAWSTYYCKMYDLNTVKTSQKNLKMQFRHYYYKLTQFSP